MHSSTTPHKPRSRVLRALAGSLLGFSLILGVTAGTAAPAQAATPIASQCTGNYSVGSYGTCVWLIQQGLNTLGYTGSNDQALALDSDFGPNTRAAVLKFQAAKGLTQDGIAGKNTIAALDKALGNTSTAAISITSAFPDKLNGTTANWYTYYVYTSAPASKLTFQFSGNSAVYTVSNAGILSSWGPSTYAFMSNNRQTWQIQNDTLGAGQRTITVTAYSMSGVPSAPRSFVINVSQPMASIAAQCTGNYSVGSSGTCVKLIQQGLNSLGYTDAYNRALVVDGSFGANTRAAVIMFQRAKGLTADGIAGRNTITALDKALGR